MFKKGLRKFAVLALSLTFICSVAAHVVVVNAEEVQTTVSLSEAMKDVSNWGGSANAVIALEDGRLSLTNNDGKRAVFSYPLNGSYLVNQMVEFTLNFEAIPETGNVLVLATRHGNMDNVVWGNPSKNGYLSWINVEGLDLQKWVDGTQTIFVNEIANPFTEAGKDYKIEFGAVPVGDGIKMVLKVDGTIIAEAVDTEGDVPLENSYFTIYATTPAKISAESTTAAAPTPVPTVEPTPAPTVAPTVAPTPVPAEIPASGTNPKTLDSSMMLFIALGVISLLVAVIYKRKLTRG